LRFGVVFGSCGEIEWECWTCICTRNNEIIIEWNQLINMKNIDAKWNFVGVWIIY
jgi:hypothetical protein